MGLIIVQFEDKDGNQISDKEGTYYAPSTEGIILIIDVDNDILTLVSPADTVYDFNLAIEQFVSTEKHKVKSRSSGDGRIYESNLIPYPIDGYIFNNYW